MRFRVSSLATEQPSRPGSKKSPSHARRAQRSFTVSHFAQSLDGRVATDFGDSRQIGCAENLVHAHRMRALCDGILIGATTLRVDRPALNVRYAEGPDPARIVVGSVLDVEIDCLRRASPSPIILIGDGDPPTSAQVERLALPSVDGRIPTAAILSVIIEEVAAEHEVRIQRIR